MHPQDYPAGYGRDSFRFGCNIEAISLVLTNETWNRSFITINLYLQ